MFEGEKVLITGASGKIAFPIASALAKDNEVWGVARLGIPINDNAPERRHATRPARRLPRRLLLVPRGLHLRLPRRRRHRRRRLASLRRDQCPGLGRPHATTAAPQRLRLLLDGLDLRVPGPAAPQESIHRASPSERTTASRRSPGSRSAPGWPAFRRSRSRSSASAPPMGPKAGAPPTASSRCSRGEPIRLHPDAAEQLQPDLRGRLRRARHQGDGGRRACRRSP